MNVPGRQLTGMLSTWLFPRIHAHSFDFLSPLLHLHATTRVLLCMRQLALFLHVTTRVCLHTTTRVHCARLLPHVAHENSCYCLLRCFPLLLALVPRRDRSLSPPREQRQRRARSLDRGRARYDDGQGGGDDGDHADRARARGTNHRENNGQSFRDGASSSVRSACVICLGRHQHDVLRCTAQYFHGTTQPTRATRSRSNSDSILLRGSKARICLHFNLPKGCRYSASDAHPLHECTGCGSTAHGAQRCSVGQKA